MTQQFRKEIWSEAKDFQIIRIQLLIEAMLVDKMGKGEHVRWYQKGNDGALRMITTLDISRESGVYGKHIQRSRRKIKRFWYQVGERASGRKTEATKPDPVKRSERHPLGFCSKGHWWDFSSGPVAKIPSSQCWGTRLDPFQGTKFQTSQQRLKILHATTMTWHSQIKEYF